MVRFEHEPDFFMPDLPASLTHGAYERLRADLLANRFAPGEKLKIDDLCERFSVGSSAVREALSRLASEGFVVSEPQRGFRVAPLSLEALRDLTDVRCKIEGLCLRGAIEKGDVEWQANVVAALHRLSHTPAWSDQLGRPCTAEFSKAHAQFHETLAAGCGSPWLMHLRQLLFLQSERYRWFSTAVASEKRDLEKEHRQIAEAVLARDADKAVRLMDDHLRKTADIILVAATQPRKVDGSRTKTGERGAQPALS